MSKVYLAGPEVFFANGNELIEQKKDIARHYGFTPVASVEEDDFPSGKFESGMFISTLNERLMKSADFIIANLTPFRGISADVGTVFELGFMCALGRPVFGYSNDPRDYDERAANDYYVGAIKPVDGLLRAPDGQMVEDHEMADNLMIDGGIIARGGQVIRPNAGARLANDDTSMFESCLAAARDYFAMRA
ncbi:nucleoside 2-deoxyribosyltransferase [Pelagibacterium xiamenense]|uniref:nucleoside 2-deoxyribosyltransferase n=1 Tax=Pelagibacterium xiamenense TaxID=2901140 RepID=UPI001E34AA90|nr:nucleoside 2-deoxyribosyltransferase [Pelagibacterium xiamenense]MCD7060709.1 nucleoside 2-deoxyribosyltransferase [Pelagibacterium xiamenense]